MRAVILFLSLFLLLLFSGCSQRYYQGNRASGHHGGTMRTYNVNGRHYTPSYVKIGQTMYGKASWYGSKFHGKKTSSGEIYNMYARTAAHKTWPMGTMVKVTNLDNGRQTTVRINDRGPFVQGRVIDVSYKAGKELGLDKSGVARAKLEVVGFAGKVYPHSGVAQQGTTGVQTRVRLSNFGVQVGAFRRYEGARVYQQRFANYDPRYKVIIKKFYDTDGMPLYRVWMMGFGSEQEARDYKTAHDMPGAFIVRN